VGGGRRGIGNIKGKERFRAAILSESPLLC